MTRVARHLELFPTPTWFCQHWLLLKGACKIVRIPDPPPGRLCVVILPMFPSCISPLPRGANALITGDQDLLSLASDFSCPIITAEQFMNRAP